MYSVVFYKPYQLQEIRSCWEKLEKGIDMTYFQSYDWNEMLVPYLKPDNLLHENIYALVRNSHNDPVLIAPLWIVKYSIFPFFNRRGIYFIGRSGWPDYLNMIYDQFDSQAVEVLLVEVKKKYHVSLFCPQLLKEDSELYRHIEKKPQIKNGVSNSVKLDLPLTVDDYIKSLSKGVRQNIRTAHNRISKDGLSIRFIFDDVQVDKEKCKAIRNQRLVKKNHIPSLRTRFNVWVMKHLSFSFPDYLPLEIDKNTQVMSAYIGDELVAFFQYGYNEIHKSIVLMAVGTNAEYSRYSPGLLLMYNYILEQIEKKKTKIVDFTRGNERYKYWLGGTEYPMHHMMIKI